MTPGAACFTKIARHGARKLTYPTDTRSRPFSKRRHDSRRIVVDSETMPASFGCHEFDLLNLCLAGFGLDKRGSGGSLLAMKFTGLQGDPLGV